MYVMSKKENVNNEFRFLITAPLIKKKGSDDLVRAQERFIDLKTHDWDRRVRKKRGKVSSVVEDLFRSLEMNPSNSRDVA